MQRRELVSALAVSTLASAAVASPGFAAERSGPPEWEAILTERLPLYGHRNWIVVADSAYPLQSRPGIETVVSGTDHFRVLAHVFARLSESKHVRPVVFEDRELQFLREEDAPGVEAFRMQLASVLNGAQVSAMLHENIINRLDQTAQTFNVLIIKTTLTIPYTSVFFELNCAYWSDSAEKGLRASMPPSRG